MPNPQPPRLLSAYNMEAIFAVAGRAGPYQAVLIEAVRRWLGGTLNRALRRTKAEPVTKADVDRVRRAYIRFHRAIEDLQDRFDAPPPIPVTNGSTEWEEWLTCFEVFPFERGRPEESDWTLIGALLGLYEFLSDNRASAAQAEGPTMRFLASALNELSACVPPQLRSNFAMPSAEAVRKQLPRLRNFDIPSAKKRLESLAAAGAG